MVPISQTGTIKLKSSNSNFILSEALCAPNMKQNLLSVSKFCCDNEPSIEFFPSYFCVKDLSTRAVLACGPNKSGLYEWSSVVSHHASTRSPIVNSSTILVSRWNQRLGHPNLKILKSLLHKFSLSYRQMNNFSIYNACCCGKSHRLSFSNNSLQISIHYK